MGMLIIIIFIKNKVKVSSIKRRQTLAKTTWILVLFHKNVTNMLPNIEQSKKSKERIKLHK